MPTRHLGVVLKGYPRLSETFIAQELRELEARGFTLTLFSLRHPTELERHPVHGEIRARVIYLPEYLHQEPWRVLRAAVLALRRPAVLWATLRLFLADLVRDFTRNRVRRLGQALVLAAECPPEIEQLYVHFIHTPGSVTRYAAHLTGLPWAASAHAKDVWTQPEWEIRAKLADMQWLATCTRANHNYLSAFPEGRGKVHLVYHGISFARFPPPPPPPAARDGSDPARPVELLSVGRAVAKKGYDDLLAALATLPAGLCWRLTHIGGGPLLPELQHQAERLGLTGRIRWRGALPQQEVLAAYREADLFVLPCKVVDGGDRDGLPNVLLEAQSQGVCCLSTRLSGIPELIVDGTSGVLVEAGDVAALAAALARLIADPRERQRLAEAGAARVRADFAMERGIERLLACFDASRPATEPPCPVSPSTLR
ncbi:glycosyltransferase family 4 protein [Pseudogulbenkiania sp. MAI-1]|uniref:glycosyltransferase family 4 protein n=1 Tax=Pseudogulbenkiania sp. MAI-1 TaxID=990370 RepID=UPI00045E8924|nr:glycosyltransferase family 4 protein [Pseudogulbenkiania sp. MAI-1]